MERNLESLLEILDLEELEVNLFRGRASHETRQRVFGGQVLGQALAAANRTVEDHAAHSLHAYFLRPGAPDAPILYQVDRTRDGKSFTTRRVKAIQGGRAIFHLEASFHRDEEGPTHQLPMPDVPDPESLPTRRERLRPMEGRHTRGDDSWIRGEWAVDLRYATPVDPVDPGRLPPHMNVWIRCDGRVPDETWIQQCLLAYASDLVLIDAALLPHGMDVIGTGFQIASLDHAMWFHQRFEADEWLLYALESPIAHGARGFATGRVFARDGRLVASVVQEGLTRFDRDGD
jgi:acyl-CoA thioesterase-2